MPQDPTALAKQLVDQIRGYQAPAVVAFSGGVDSVVVAKAAFLADSETFAVTAISPSFAQGELQTAQEAAQSIGLKHRTLQTAELDNPLYIRNEGDRCFHCKNELYSQLEALIDEFGSRYVVLNGTNVDDLGDYRPGLQAAANHAVRSPLVDCGFGKETVRQLARHWELPVWNKPATPCLSSRIAYGEAVTPERLAMVDQAESWIRTQFGIQEFRVRYHRGDLARLEFHEEDLPMMLAASNRERVVEYLKSIGFRFVTIDLTAFQSGSLNALIQIAAPGQSR